MSVALLLVDLQADYFSDDELARCRDDLVRTVSGLVERARAAGVLVVQVRTVHSHDRSTWALNMREDDQGMVLDGTPGAEWLPGAPEGEVLVTKIRDSAFHDTDLLAVLRRHDVEHLVLAGVSTESCIAATAVDAYAHDLRVTLVCDATASVSADEHDHTLALLHTLYRQPAVPAADVTF